MRYLYATHFSMQGNLAIRCLFFLLMLLAVMPLAPAGVVHASVERVALDFGTEDGGVKQHDLFAFEAFVTHADIKDGTAPFDADNAPGNDADVRNGLVRSFDTVVYPIKITVNPKNADMLENIRLNITGTLDGGMTDGRVHARFAVGGTENLESGEVSFTQNYTIERTGNSVMIPVAVNVGAAAPGVFLTPELQVEVVSVDGEPVTGVVTRFDELPPVMVSAKINIEPIVGEGMTGKGIPYYPLSGITGVESERANTHGFAVSWSVRNLPGKTDMRGATVPGPDGVINYRVELDGHVAWDEPGVRTDSVDFDFEMTDSPFLLYDQQPVNAATQKIGSAHLLMDGLPYDYRYSNAYAAAQSALPDFSQETIEKRSSYSVWDSGDWSVSPPDVRSGKVVYDGHNTGFVVGSTFPVYRGDGFTGERVYGQDEKVFATNGFVVRMPNEYRIAGPLNPDGLANNVGYKATVVLENYTAPDGTVTPFNLYDDIEFTERNLPDGSYSVQNTFKAYPSGKELGTPYAGWDVVSKGDASTLIGEDVYFEASLGSNVISYGGYEAVYRWNTDAFELTERYAQVAEENIMQAGYILPTLDRVRNNPERQFVRYGVATFTDNAFDVFTDKGITDYTWFDSYNEAAKRGAVGAIQVDVTAPIGAKWQASGRIPLGVRHDNIGIGATTKQGTPAIAVTNFYPYVKDDRDGGNNRIDASESNTYRNPAIWSEAGELLERQSPYGETVNFETLAVRPATAVSEISAGKASYYISETLYWSVESSVQLPASGLPDGFDGGVVLTQVLPAGLVYEPGSGSAGGELTEPEVAEQRDGTTELTWDVLVGRAGSVPDISFQTVINPLALGFTGVRGSLTVTNVIETPLDGRPVHLRTHSETVTILKVGMVGIFESIDTLHGGKNSDFTVTLRPYTTIDDERDVTGLTLLPLSGDALGSDYTGEAFFKAVTVTSIREHDEQVRIYLNNAPVTSDHPHEIDVTQNGWYEYTGAEDVRDAVSLLFRVEGTMTRSDDIQIKLDIGTSGNAFGDMYLSRTVINSATDYNLSPVSNKVRYTIRADWEITLERVRIYTDLAERGLPVSVRIWQHVLDEERAKTQPVTLAVYDTVSGNKVTQKTVTQSELERENELLIPSAGLVPGDVRTYEIRLEDVDKDRVWVKDGEIQTDGHAAIEGTLTNADKDASGAVVFRDVVMTERIAGESMTEFTETIGVVMPSSPRVKAGYGFDVTAGIAYRNEVLNDTVARTGALTESPAVFAVDSDVIEPTLDYHDEASPESIVPLLAQPVTEFGVTGMQYGLPSAYLEQASGRIVSAGQYARGETSGAVRDAGQRLYVPVWLNATGAYAAAFRTTEPLGVHRMMFDIEHPVEVYAYMFHHTDTETSDLDELLVGPVPIGAMTEAFGE